MKNEIIEIVNTSGKIIGLAARPKAYQEGLLHKAVNILVFNTKQELYIQRRSADKMSFPLFWDISCSEHLKPKETFRKAAVRGLWEELSVKAKVKLLRNSHIQKSEFKINNRLIKEYELVKLYGTIYNAQIKIDPQEVTEDKFISLNKLKKT